VAGGGEGGLDASKCTEALLDEEHPAWKRAAWIVAMLIPPGYAATYKAVAELIGVHPRRVAAAMKTNPCPPIIPCHRVVSSRGLGGYTPGGRRVKERLLRLEAGGGEVRRVRTGRELEELVFPDP